VVAGRVVLDEDHDVGATVTRGLLAQQVRVLRVAFPFSRFMLARTAAARARRGRRRSPAHV
jgi:hypothetical protein